LESGHVMSCQTFQGYPPAPDGMPGRYFAAAPAAQQLKLAARLQIGFRPI
jgi:hypothetical protein